MKLRLYIYCETSWFCVFKFEVLAIPCSENIKKVIEGTAYLPRYKGTKDSNALSWFLQLTRDRGKFLAWVCISFLNTCGINRGVQFLPFSLCSLQTALVCCYFAFNFEEKKRFYFSLCYTYLYLRSVLRKVNRKCTKKTIVVSIREYLARVFVCVNSMTVTK